MDDQGLQKAKKVFHDMCTVLEKHDWHFEMNEDDLSISCGAKGDDIPIPLVLRVDAERRLLMLLSFLPFPIPEEKRLDIAVAINQINLNMVDGSFDYDVRSGRVIFRMTTSFIESEIGEEAFLYMVYVSCQTVDNFNDKLMMIANGMLSLEQFLASYPG